MSDRNFTEYTEGFVDCFNGRRKEDTPELPGSYREGWNKAYSKNCFDQVRKKSGVYENIHTVPYLMAEIEFNQDTTKKVFFQP